MQLWSSHHDDPWHMFLVHDETVNAHILTASGVCRSTGQNQSTIGRVFNRASFAASRPKLDNQEVSFGNWLDICEVGPRDQQSSTRSRPFTRWLVGSAHIALFCLGLLSACVTTTLNWSRTFLGLPEVVLIDLEDALGWQLTAPPACPARNAICIKQIFWQNMSNKIILSYTSNRISWQYTSRRISSQYTSNQIRPWTFP